MKLDPLPTWFLATLAVLDWIMAMSAFLGGRTAFGIFMVAVGALCVLAILFRS